MQTDSKLEMAREICAATYTKAAGRICSHTDHIEAKYRQGLLDGEMEVRAALAAIEECTEAHAQIAENERLRHDKGDGFDCQPARSAAFRIREAIRDHLKGPTDA